MNANECFKENCSYLWCHTGTVHLGQDEYIKQMFCHVSCNTNRCYYILAENGRHDRLIKVQTTLKNPLVWWVTVKVFNKADKTWLYCNDAELLNGQMYLKKVKVAHTRLPSVGFRSWSQFLAVSLQVTWVITLAAGCHYLLPGPQIPSQPLRGPLPISLLGEQRHDGCEQFA